MNRQTFSPESDRFMNLYIYNDSLAFRRPEQSEDLALTYPFLLKDMIEKRIGLRVNLLLRGIGGAGIKEIQKIILRDSGYLVRVTPSLNVVILQFGIVDCAPRPITFLLKPLLDRIPRIGAKIMSVFIKHRRWIQVVCNYRKTPIAQFKRRYKAILRVCIRVGTSPLATGMPLPPHKTESRSPGFRQSVTKYNQAIREISSEAFCDIEGGLDESLRERMLLPDGHHLTESGHQFYARALFKKMESLGLLEKATACDLASGQLTDGSQGAGMAE